jgi:hypothetical protein
MNDERQETREYRVLATVKGGKGYVDYEFLVQADTEEEADKAAQSELAEDFGSDWFIKSLHEVTTCKELDLDYAVVESPETDSLYRDAAIRMYKSSEIDIDPDAPVMVMEEYACVQAWVWVPRSKIV